MHEYVFDGTESWGTVAGSSGRPAYYRVNPGSAYKPSSTQSATTQLSNYFPYGNPTSTNALNGMSVYTSGGTTPFIRLRSPVYNTLAKIENFMAEKYAEGNPVRIVWLLGKAIQEDVVLPEILLAKGTTVIGFGTTLAPYKAEFEYIGSKY